MTSLRIKIILLFLGLTTVVAFQNCGKEDLKFNDQTVVENLSSFNYVYQQATPLYVDFKISESSSTLTSATTRNLKIIGTITPSNGDQTTIAYKVETLTSSAVRVCPLLEGQLSSGATLVISDCVANKTYLIDRIEVQAYYQNQWHKFTLTMGGI